MSALSRWWFTPAPLARIAVLRALVYGFIPIDVLVTTRWIGSHADVPGRLYEPLFVGRLLHLPTPTGTFVRALGVTLVASAVIAATNRAPRLLGAAVFVLYFEWMVIGMSYGKVDHDRFAFLVALAVLPTVGRTRRVAAECSEAAGWALRAIQVAVIATYLLSSWAKFRFGGFEWVNSAVLVTAVLRRGTALARPLLDYPWILHAAQWGIVVMELLSPVVLILRRDRLRYAFVGLLLSFHLVTYLTIRIIFLPHVVCLAAFLPLERVYGIGSLRLRSATGAPGAR